jgi:hypothetical protein
VKRTVVVVVGVVILIGVGAGAYAVGRATGRGAVASSTTSHVAPTLVHVEACPSTYGVSYGQGGTPIPSPTVPTTMAVSLSTAVASGLGLYTDHYRSLEPILAPKGWKCAVSASIHRTTPGETAGCQFELAVSTMEPVS